MAQVNPEPHPFRGTTLPVDAAWAPQVPPGHCQFTWIGHVHGATPAYSYLLGCLVDENAPAANNNIPAPKAAETKKKPEPKAAKAAAEPEDLTPTVAHLGELNFVVGKIVECKKHDGADSLYVEQIDLGEAMGGKRQIVSGLVKYLTLDQMVGSMCVVVANLKPSALRGEMSNGMVLAASNADKSEVVLVQPPAGAQPGDRLVPLDAAVVLAAPAAEINSKKAPNAWSIASTILKTNAAGEVAFGEQILGVNGKAATASLTDARVA